jgi:DNA-binding transcriptional LysR family regulator
MEQSPWMTDLNELLVFTRVVQTGSFTGAAKLLGMPKSSVSRKVSELEDRVGARLLQRTTRKLGLTDAGRIYFDRSARIVAEIEEAEHAVGRTQAEPRGLLRVTAPLSFSVLAPVVADFLRHHPDVQVDLVCTDRRVDLVEEGFDVAVRAGPLDDSTLVARRVGEAKRFLVAAPAYLKRHGTPRAPADLEKHACIVFGAGASPNVWKLTSGDASIDVQIAPRFTVNDPDILVEVARAGIGIASVPAFTTVDDLAAGRLRAVLSGWSLPAAALHVLYPTARHLSPKVAVFIDSVAKSFLDVGPR